MTRTATGSGDRLVPPQQRDDQPATMTCPYFFSFMQVLAAFATSRPS